MLPARARRRAGPQPQRAQPPAGPHGGRGQALQRERCPNDRRGTYAVINDTGRDLLARMSPVYRSTVEVHFLPHVGSDAASVHEALERVADSAREACPADPAAA